MAFAFIELSNSCYVVGVVGSVSIVLWRLAIDCHTRSVSLVHLLVGRRLLYATVHPVGVAAPVECGLVSLFLLVGVAGFSNLGATQCPGKDLAYVCHLIYTSSV